MPGAKVWDPTPAGGSLATARGEQNPSADGAALTGAEVAATRSLVSGGGNAKKTPIPQIGTALSLSDVSVVSGAPTITLTTGPNGQPG